MVEGDAETRATPVAHLILLGTEAEPQRWPIREGSLTLGRAKDCHISIADTRLSRRHTEVRCEGRRVTITDLGSVNGARIEQPQELRHGDLVRVGPFELRYEMLIPPELEIPERSTIVMEEPSRLPRLEVSRGSQRGLVIDLTRERMVVGRSGRGQLRAILGGRDRRGRTQGGRHRPDASGSGRRIACPKGQPRFRPTVRPRGEPGVSRRYGTIGRRGRSCFRRGLRGRGRQPAPLDGSRRRTGGPGGYRGRRLDPI